MKKVSAVLVILMAIGLIMSTTSCKGGWDAADLNLQLATLDILFSPNGSTRLVGDQKAKAETEVPETIKPMMEGMPAEYVLAVRGHANSVGENTATGRARNVLISKARAQAVYNVLADQGIDAEKMEVVVLSATEPVIGVPGDSGLNRRVSFLFVEVSDL